MSNGITYAISIFLIIINCIIAPLFRYGVTQYDRDVEIAQTAAKECIDKIIDTRELSKTNKEYTANFMATTNSLFEYEIERYALTINVVPEDVRLYKGEVYQRYTLSNDNEHYAKGDNVRIHVAMKNRPIFATIGSLFLGMSIPSDDITFSAIVR